MSCFDRGMTIIGDVQTVLRWFYCGWGCECHDGTRWEEKEDKCDSRWEKQNELVQLYQSNLSWTQHMIAHDSNKRHKGKEVKEA